LSGVRSGKAADWLAANGFKEVINLNGGISAWKAADKKIEIK
jgi:rhodanese-related sulfurtransferase